MDMIQIKQRMQRALDWDNIVDYAERFDLSIEEAREQIEDGWDDWFDQEFDVEDCPRWFK